MSSQAVAQNGCLNNYINKSADGESLDHYLKIVFEAKF